MQVIQYSTTTKHIFIQEGFGLTIYDAQLNVIREISLDLKSDWDHVTTHLEVFENSGIISLTRSWRKGVKHYLFDMNGNEVYSKLLSNDRQEDLFFNIDDKNLMQVMSTYDDSVYSVYCIVLKDKDEVLRVNLFEEMESSDEDQLYFEYIQCVKNTNKPYQFALIAVHANYGAERVKIFELESSGKLDVVFSMSNPKPNESSFQNLAFNSNGDKFILLVYKRRDVYEHDIYIYEYSLEDNTEPLKIFKTELGEWEYSKMYIQYINDSLLCIVMKGDIIMFDLNTGTVKEILKRDIPSAYYVDFDILIYKLNDEFLIKDYSGNKE